MRTFLWPAVLAVGSLALFAACGGDDDGGSGGDPILAGMRDYEPAVDLADGAALGFDDAPLVMQIYEDFQCPFCLRYTALDEPALVEEYVREGHLRIEFRNWPILGDESWNAAIGGMCAVEQDAFWEYHHALFLLQAEAGQHLDEQVNVGRYATEALVGIAGDAGMDASQFATCIEDSDGAIREELEGQATDAPALGLRGTPGFVLNGEALPGRPNSLDGWRQFLDSVLEGVDAE